MIRAQKTLKESPSQIRLEDLFKFKFFVAFSEYMNFTSSILNETICTLQFARIGMVRKIIWLGLKKP